MAQMNPQMLAAVMQRMQPQATNAPVPPTQPPPNAMGAQPGMPVQMTGTMMMKPAQPPGPQGMAGPGMGQQAPGAGVAPGMPQRNF